MQKVNTEVIQKCFILPLLNGKILCICKNCLQINCNLLPANVQFVFLFYVVMNSGAYEFLELKRVSALFLSAQWLDPTTVTVGAILYILFYIIKDIQGV